MRHATRHKSFPSAVGLRGFGATALALSVLAGCSSQSEPKPDIAAVKQFAGRGYITDDQYGIATSFASWTLGADDIDLALTTPVRSGLVPLVVYLPALGESRSAGEAWRSAWAQSGYAVLSLQPLAEDALAWSSAAARTGDFVALARNRYSGKVMAKRIAAIGQALAEVSHRAQQHEAPFDRIDLSRVALAGFDLGAYTAMSIAGENTGVAAPALPLRVAAVISLSPFADFSGLPFDARYADIRMPVLSVTGDDDADALGLVTSPAVRKAPFQYMPPGGKYLLSLADAHHAAFSGSAHGIAEGGEGAGAMPGASREEGQSGGRRNGRHARQEGTSRSGERGSAPGTARPSPTATAIDIAAVKSVTTAFLDAYVKLDPTAREWLKKDAPRWLGERGEITRK